MPGILFTNAWMLAGLAVLSVPILIHLLLRQKKKRVRFSTVQFFLKQDEQSAQRRKLRNWLLLALRLLICALLVFAFARPYLEIGGAAGAPGRQRNVVLLLDRSLSMHASGAEGSRWSRARESAQKILAELRPSDRAALVSCGEEAEVLCEWAPAGMVNQRLAELEPTFAAANLGAGLEQARRLLSVTDPGAAATICVISDLQRSGCLHLADCPVPQHAEIQLIPVSDLATPNLAITDLQVVPNASGRPHAVVSSFSDEDRADLTLQWSIDGQLVSSQTLTLEAGASTNVPLIMPMLKPGWHEVMVHIQGRDALPLDDSRFQSVFVSEPAKVLVTEIGRAQPVYQQETFFVTTALDPGKDSTNLVPSRFTFEKVSAEELVGKLEVQLPGQMVVLPGLRQVPSGLSEALLRFLRAGGGVLVFVGDGVSANRYNADFGAWLPVRLGRVEVKPELSLGWRIGLCDTNSAMFAPFQIPNNGDVSLARFAKRFALTPVDSSTVVARYEDGVPLVVRGSAGLGRVLLINTSVDTTWTDWPKHKTFVPWLHGAGQELVGSTITNRVVAPMLLTGVGSDLDLGVSAARAVFRVHGTGGKEHFTITADDQGQLRDVTLPSPGVYSLRDASGVEQLQVTANVSAQESDLTAIAPNEFQQQIARVRESPRTTLAAGLFGAGSNQKDLARVLLLAALGLLLVELFVANRTLA